MEKHIFIATPMYGGQCFGHYAQGLLQAQSVFQKEKIPMTISFIFNESLIQRGRNLLVQQFLKSQATHLMFIDADIKFNPADIIPMINADKDIICGIYPKKEINWDTVKQAMDKGVPNDQLKNYTGVFVANLVDYQENVKVRIDEPIEIWNGGTGFMLIKREVLESMKDSLPYYLNNTMDIHNKANGEKIVEFFSCMIEPETQLLLSEDYYFCRKAREAGFKVWAAPWAGLTHIGTYPFEGRLIPA